MKPISVCAAIIRNKTGQYLITSRPRGKAHANQWEFPGGKKERGESNSECLKREIIEELMIDIIVLDQIYQITHSYHDKTVKLLFFRSFMRKPDQAITPMENQLYRWCNVDDLPMADLLPADMPIAEFLISKESFHKNIKSYNNLLKRDVN